MKHILLISCLLYNQFLFSQENSKRSKDIPNNVKKNSLHLTNIFKKRISTYNNNLSNIKRINKYFTHPEDEKFLLSFFKKNRSIKLPKIIFKNGTYSMIIPNMSVSFTETMAKNSKLLINNKLIDLFNIKRISKISELLGQTISSNNSQLSILNNRLFSFFIPKTNALFGIPGLSWAIVGVLGLVVYSVVAIKNRSKDKDTKKNTTTQPNIKTKITPSSTEDSLEPPKNSREFSTTNGVVRLMPIGDSITQSAAGIGGWRCELWNLIGIDGKYDFVGSNNKGMWGDIKCVYPNFDKDHEGYWGWSAGKVLTIIDKSAAKYKPDVVLIHLGTNDVRGGKSNDRTISDIGSIIDTIRKYNSKTTFFVAGIIPGYENNMGPKVIDFNQLMKVFTEQKGNVDSAVIFVDHHTGFSKEDMMDNLHPNHSGMQKMASNWHKAIEKYLNSTK